MPSPDTDPRVVHVARQAILDARGHVIGYELLYRGGPGSVAGAEDEDYAGARLLSDAVLDLRLETMTDGRTAFINLTRSLLLNGAATLLRPGAAVFELRQHIEVDAEILEACRSLSAAGYRLVIADFSSGSVAEVLLPFASFIKVNVNTMPRAEVVDLARRLAARGLPLLTTGVDTRESFDWAREAGASLFQGVYFCEPQIRTGGALTSHASHLRLLSALNQPKLTMDELEELVKQDAILSLRVLQCINSAAFAIRREVRSIREALVLLGMGPIRKWASVWCLAKLNVGSTSELGSTALLRARTCERLAEDREDVDPHEMFLVGLCSVLDAMLGKPMRDIVASLPLSEPARSALLGEQNALRSILEAVIAYERGHWEEAVEVCAVAGGGVSELTLSHAYGNALAWAHELSSLNLGA